MYVVAIQAAACITAAVTTEVSRPGFGNAAIAVLLLLHILTGFLLYRAQKTTPNVLRIGIHTVFHYPVLYWLWAVHLLFQFALGIVLMAVSEFLGFITQSSLNSAEIMGASLALGIIFVILVSPFQLTPVEHAETKARLTLVLIRFS